MTDPTDPTDPNYEPETMTVTWTFEHGRFRLNSLWTSWSLDARYLVGFPPSEWEGQINRLCRHSLLATEAVIARENTGGGLLYLVDITGNDTDPITFTRVSTPEQKAA